MTNSYLGDVDDRLDFEYGAETEVRGSCGASLNDEMFVIGGYYEKRQVYINNGKMQNKFPENDNFSIFHWFLHFMLIPMV